MTLAWCLETFYSPDGCGSRRRGSTPHHHDDEVDVGHQGHGLLVVVGPVRRCHGELEKKVYVFVSHGARWRLVGPAARRCATVTVQTFPTTQVVTPGVGRRLISRAACRPEADTDPLATCVSVLPPKELLLRAPRAIL